MNIQESNNVTGYENEIKVEKFEESASVTKPNAQIISVESQSEKNFSLKDCSFIKRETVVFKTEKDNNDHELTESKLHERETKDEYFDVPEFITHEDIVIKTEDLEQDQSNSKNFDSVHEESRKTFKCSYCSTGLSTKKYKNAHERRCKFQQKEQPLGGSVFECTYCKLLYTREEDKNKHQVVCKKRRESEGFRYEENTTKKGQTRYCCDKCNYETHLKDSFIRHIRIHDKVNAPKYSCNQCPYQTIHNSDIQTHLRTHNCFGLICSLCQKSFKRKYCLDAHYVSRHPDRSDQWGSTVTHKINECPKCLYKTVITRNFKDHLATHGTPEEQAQYQCNICEFKCIRKNSYTTHLRLHVGQLPFVCTECDQRFNTKRQLDGHIISRHSGNEGLMSSVTSKVHQCDKCTFKTVVHTGFKNHLKTCLGKRLS